MIVLRWIVRVVVGLIAAVVLVVVGARFHDGPLGPLPGGSLTRGILVTEPVRDWTFAADVQEVELQLESQSKSRTTWIVVHQGKAYIPAATAFPPGKTWHRAALDDGRAIVRIAGKRYPVTLVKLEDPPLFTAVIEVAKQKYPARPEGEVWLFTMRSRPG